MLNLAFLSNTASIDASFVIQTLLFIVLTVIIFRIVGKRIGGLDVLYGALPARSWLMIGGLVAIVIGHLIVGADNPQLTVERSTMLLIYLMIGLLIFLSFQRMTPPDVLVAASIAIGGVGVLYALLSAGWFVVNGAPAGPLCETQIPIFTNVRHTAHFSTPALGLAIFVASSRDVGRMFRLLAGIMAVILWAYLEYTGSRGAIFALLGAALVAAIFLPLRPVAALTITGFVTFAIAMALMVAVPPAECGSFGLFNRMQTSFETGEVTTGRFDVWRASWDLIVARPLFGYGEIHLEDVTDFTIAQAHNTILQAFLTWGFVGGTLFLGLIAEFLLRSMMLARTRPWQAWPILFALLSAFAYGMIDGTLHHSFSLFIVTIMVAASGALIFRPKPHPDA